MRLLIVDDDMAVVDAMMSSIDYQSLGIDEVCPAYSVAQARALIDKKPADIVVSDIEMPMESGLELLSWMRSNGCDTEFILLTCHEKFDYAASALKLNAAEYLTKPYDAQIMELTLRKTIAKVVQKQQRRESSRHDEWFMKNLREEQLYFWVFLFSGVLRQDRERLRCEIEARGLPIDVQAGYRLVVTRLTGYQRQLEELGEELFFFALENQHSRILCGQEENCRVVRRARGGDAHGGVATSGELWLLSVAEGAEDAELKRRCDALISACASAVKAELTCIIGEQCHIEELARKAEELEQLVRRSVAYYGQAFFEADAAGLPRDESQILDIDRLAQLLGARDGNGLMNYLKTVLKRKTENKTLDERGLYLIKQELVQAVYAELMRSGIQATRLFHDENSIRLADSASHSTVDMLRYAGYLLERTFASEEELENSATLISKIRAYIQEHYQEDIGRGEIAAQFHLAPEYLSKLYRRRTGKYLKDDIREYRMERAKQLLQNEEVLVSDVAGAVGIDNFSYFSTLFRKHTGMSPNEYRRMALNKKI